MKKLRLFSVSVVTFLFFGVLSVSALSSAEEENLYKKVVPDGKNFVVKSVKPTDSAAAEAYLTAAARKLLDEDGYITYSYCLDNDFINCKLHIERDGEESNKFNKEYDIVVKYIEPEKSNYVTKFMSKMKNFDDMGSTQDQYYQVTDMGLINYYMTSSKSELWNYGASGRAVKYSSDLIKLSDGGNISFDLDVRAGIQSTDFMYENAFGPMTVYYNGAIYGYKTQGLYFRRVIYIPQDTEDTKEDYIRAAQERINEYLGNDEVKVEYGGLLSSLADLDPDALDTMVDINDTDGNYYNVTVKEKTYKFYIMKGTKEQLVVPTYLGLDVDTNIKITSDSSLVPLDTSLIVSPIVSDKIKAILGTDNYKAFDIKLYSDGKGAFIEKLEDKFLVRIPVPEEYEGKELIVYYINSNDEKEEHNVVIENGFATFETDHFSTYILTEIANGDQVINPDTSDKIMLYACIGVVALVGILGCLVYIKRKKSN